jgi:EF hand
MNEPKMTETPDNNTQNGKQAKKTEVIEVRLPYDQKQSFMDACKASNKTASSVLRGAIDVFMSAGHFGAKPAKYRSYTMILTGMIFGAGLFGLATLNSDNTPGPTNSRPTYTNTSAADAVAEDQTTALINPLIKLKFSKLDRNTDYLLDVNEFGMTYGYGNVLEKLDLSKPIIVAPDKYRVLTADYDKLIKKPYYTGVCFGNLFRVIRPLVAQRFYLIDTNHDNKLTVAEYANDAKLPSTQALQQAYQVLDKNSDGTLSLKEVRIDIKKWVAAHDLRKNKQLLYTVPVPDECKNAGNKRPKINSKDIVPADPKKKPTEYLVVGYGKLERMFEPNAKGGVSKKRFDTLDNDKSAGLSFEEFIVWYL